MTGERMKRMLTKESNARGSYDSQKCRNAFQTNAHVLQCSSADSKKKITQNFLSFPWLVIPFRSNLESFLDDFKMEFLPEFQTL